MNNRIREIRKAKGLTLSKLAGFVDISIAYLSDIENGNRHGSETTLCRIADALGVKVADFYQ